MTKFSNLKEKDKLSETQYYSVVKIQGDKVQLVNDFQELIVVDQGYVETCLISANQFEETKAITRTEMASLFITSSGIVLTVNFNKQVEEKTAKSQLYELYANKGGKILSEADYKKSVDKIIKSVIVGEERTMIGRHFGSLNEFGRVQFVDMELDKDPAKTYDTRLRQVDPRTINELIVRGVKYTIK